MPDPSGALPNGVAASAVYTSPSAPSTSAQSLTRTVSEQCVQPSLSCSIHGLFVGHGSSTASDICARNFVSLVCNDPILVRNPSIALRNACDALEAFVLAKSSLDRMYYGTTLLAVLLDHTSLHLVNIGNSRALLVSNDSFVALTTEHDSTNASEVRRVRDAGGFFHDGRVNNLIRVTRSIGDLELKGRKHITFPSLTLSADLVVNHPEITSTTLSPQHHFLVIADPQVWQHLPNETVVLTIRNALNRRDSPRTAAKRVATAAIATGAQAPVTVLVLVLNPALVHDHSPAPSSGSWSAATTSLAPSASAINPTALPSHHSEPPPHPHNRRFSRSPSSSPSPSPPPPDQHPSHHRRRTHPTSWQLRGKPRWSASATTTTTTPDRPRAMIDASVLLEDDDVVSDAPPPSAYLIDDTPNTVVPDRRDSPPVRHLHHHDGVSRRPRAERAQSELCMDPARSVVAEPGGALVERRQSHSSVPSTRNPPACDKPSCLSPSEEEQGQQQAHTTRRGSGTWPMSELTSSGMTGRPSSKRSTGAANNNNTPAELVDVGMAGPSKVRYRDDGSVALHGRLAFLRDLAWTRSRKGR